MVGSFYSFYVYFELEIEKKLHSAFLYLSGTKNQIIFLSFRSLSILPGKHHTL